MSKEIISTENAPQAIGPYSQAVKAGGLMFISGQIPLNPETGDLISGSIEDEANQVLQNTNLALQRVYPKDKVERGAEQEYEKNYNKYR